MPETRNAILYLPADGGIEALLLRDLLAASNSAHSGFLAFERIVRNLAFWNREFAPSRYRGADWWMYPIWDLPDLSESFVFGDELLIVTRVELGSPGFWEFLGALNPLEVIRQYLNDRHRRKQDREYRDREEARMLGLENDLREIDVVRQRIDAAREYGVPDEALTPLLKRLLGEPLEELGNLQDRGVIDGSRSEIRQLPPGESRRANTSDQ